MIEAIETTFKVFWLDPLFFTVLVVAIARYGYCYLVKYESIHSSIYVSLLAGAIMQIYVYVGFDCALFAISVLALIDFWIDKRRY